MPDQQPQFDGQAAVPGYTLFHGKDGKSFYLKGENLSDSDIASRVATLRGQSSPAASNGQSSTPASTSPGFTEMMQRIEIAKQGGKVLAGETPTDALNRISQTRTLQNMTSAMAGQEYQNPEDRPAGEAGRKAGMKAAAETVGMVLGGESVPAMRGLVGVLVRMLGSGGGAAAGNVAGQLGTTGKVDPMEAVKTGGTVAALQAGGEGLFAALPAIKSSLSRLMYTSAGDLSPLARSIIHPTELPEIALRKFVPEPPSYPGASQPSAEEFYANRGKDLMSRGRQQAILDSRARIDAARTASNAPQPSPFGNATPTNAPIGNATLPQGNPTPFAQPDVQMVNKFEPPTPSKIVSPRSSVPSVRVTYESVPQKQLFNKMMNGDMDAVVEWQRRGLPLPENVKYLLEQ